MGKANLLRFIAGILVANFYRTLSFVRGMGKAGKLRENLKGSLGPS